MLVTRLLEVLCVAIDRALYRVCTKTPQATKKDEHIFFLGSIVWVIVSPWKPSCRTDFHYICLVCLARRNKISAWWGLILKRRNRDLQEKLWNVTGESVWVYLELISQRVGWKKTKTFTSSAACCGEIFVVVLRWWILENHLLCSFTFLCHSHASSRLLWACSPQKHFTSSKPQNLNCSKSTI